MWGGRGGEELRFRANAAEVPPNPLLVALSLRTFFRQPKESARTNVLRKSNVPVPLRHRITRPHRFSMTRPLNSCLYSPTEPSHLAVMEIIVAEWAIVFQMAMRTIITNVITGYYLRSEINGRTPR